MQFKSFEWTFGGPLLRRRAARPGPLLFSLDAAPSSPDILGSEQLVRHATALAASHALEVTPSGQNRLLARLDENERVIHDVHGHVAAAAAATQHISPAAEWLLDNFYLVQEHIQLARRHLPRGYSRELPRLRAGPHAGLPRIYAVSVELITHSDGRVDLDNLQRFVKAYQAGASLRLGELWAVPIMLRLAVIENIRQACERIAARRRDRDLAARWAAEFLQLARNKPKSLVVALGDLVRSDPPMTRPFLAELASQLQGQHAALGLILQWLEQELSERGQSVEQVIQAESQDQSADQASFANSVTALRTLTTIDWADFVESQSVTEAWLRGDPAGTYALMDFRTRDRYRHRIEVLARHSKHEEPDIAREAVLLARTPDPSGNAVSQSAAEAHVGYYLIGPGRRTLETRIEYRPPFHVLLRRIGAAIPGWLYLALSVIAVVVLAGMIIAALPWQPSWAYGIAVVLALLIASQPALTLANWVVTMVAAPRWLPRMAFKEGIPNEFRTLVAVPGMLGSTSAARALVEGLEVRFLANREPNLIFALLTDFPDAPDEKSPDDEKILAVASAGITQLNERYGDSGGDRFFLLHRSRRWSESERVWMGYERKRGKLEQLNALLRGGAADAFTTTVGNLDALRGVRFVLVLDADTQLPPRSASQLAGTLAHPLNRPVIDPATRRVVRGYGILQPRVSTALSGAARSRYTRLFSADAGVDPYTSEVSDVYHDLFAEASYIGKGIYDLEAFSTCLAGRLPENTVLSHDLLESGYARCGFVSDVELLEDYPSRYTADTGRRHRWVRGDWQILPWLLRRTPTSQQGREANPLSALSRWKILDNLRRSLVPAGVLALWLLSWCLFPPGNALVGVTIGVLILPRIARALVSLVRKPRDSGWGRHLHWSLGKELAPLAQFALGLVFLPYEALVFLDAIGRVLWRKLISHHRLLEWQISTDLERAARIDPAGLYRSMWAAAVAGAALAAGVIGWRWSAAPTALPLALIWVGSPLAAWWLSKPLVASRFEFNDSQRVFLGKVARRTWRYFEVYVGPRTNWLAPDNVQEIPQERIAERTSPTNIGLGLLAGLCAVDFGYITASAFIERTENALTTLERLERFRGHFLNWYNTQTCQTMAPRYVSMVDSGNLAACLATLTGGIDELRRAPILPPRWLSGIRDTAEVLRDELKGPRRGAKPDLAQTPPAAIEKIVNELLVALTHMAPTTQHACQVVIDQLLRLTTRLREASGGGGGAGGGTPDVGVTWWIEALHRQVAGAGEQLAYFLPWPPPTEGELQLLGQALTEANANTDEVKALIEQFRAIPSLETLASTGEQSAALLELADKHISGGPLAPWLTRARERIDSITERAARQLDALESLRQRCAESGDMDFGFLFDPGRKLFAIGYQVDHRRLDPSHYDLLASEARLGSYVAVARGQVPPEHWFLLSRTLTPADGGATLVSWAGSMFEYLMPMLMMPTFSGTLLDRACGTAVDCQIEYGRQVHVPWGMSESGYNLLDAQQNYQYRAFGVPALGLKRGLAADLVVAPYAAVMSLMVRPQQSLQNLRHMNDEGWLGANGFYEAIDFTPARVPTDQKSSIVRSFMAHHSGMSFLSLCHVLLGQPMQRRFMADAEFRANVLLLQERVPAPGAFMSLDARANQTDSAAHGAEQRQAMRTFTSPNTPSPAVGLLSNGRYHVVFTNGGGGYSRWNDLALTRWHEDPTRDSDGFFCYLRDVDHGRIWSAAHQPTGAVPDKYEAIFMQARVECRRVDDRIETFTQVSVSPEDDVEVRKVTLTNLGDRRRRIELTTYGEVVLAPPAADAAHRVFSNLFVQTQVLPEAQAILCTRRPRAAGETPPWMFHSIVLPETSGTPGDGGTAGGGGGGSQGHHDGSELMPATLPRAAARAGLSFETDRSRFIGRGRTTRNPLAMESTAPLSGSSGAVLDPIVAIRCTIDLEPGQSVDVHLVLGAAPTHDATHALMEKYRDRRLSERVFETAWTHSQIILQHLGASEADAQLFSRLAGSLIYADASLRAAPAVVARNRRGQPGLWGYGISGDLPIVLVQLSGADPRLELVRQVLQAHAYWRTKGVMSDLVILVEEQEGYRQRLFDHVTGLVGASVESALVDKPGGVFVRNAEQVPEPDRVLMESVARLVLNDRAGVLGDQARRFVRSDLAPKMLRPGGGRARIEAPARLPKRDLVHFNGLGGFTADGHEYVLTLEPGATTPAPWCNVLANGIFGSVISEAGAAYTWAENAHEFRLTPWHNDPVSDASGEALYIRDEATGRFWSPTPLPARGNTAYVTRHGLGYSAFEHQENGVASELTAFVAVDAPVKVLSLKLRNVSTQPIRLSVMGYWAWVLGDLREKTAMHVVSRLDARTGALLASCSFNPDFANYVGFVHCSLSDRTFTTDRTEFIGRNGSTESPAAMRYQRLSNRVGATFDPCAAIQAPIELAPGEQRQVVFLLGAGKSEREASALVQRFRGPAEAHHALEEVWALWQRMLGNVRIETPDSGLNFLANYWLPYQTIACRLWGRSGYYQSGGAFGFRDQLQDAMGLLTPCPWLLREQLLAAAAHQFREGDVQHWWHPPTGRGVRTQFSDDYLWLPYAAARYVLGTHDVGVLDQEIGFLEDRQLKSGEESYYGRPEHAAERATLYEHCLRAIDHALQRFGANGLPLMGCGDWNDGMNRVGQEGKGESVWLAFFLFDVLKQFARVAAMRKDQDVVERFQAAAAKLHADIEANAWDGQWYRRAYFDNGTPLGSEQNSECQIDSLPQSWAVLSGAAEPQRATQAMDAVDRRLVRRDLRLIQLFDPPFDKADMDPGYIKGYVPGVRENGGQYTHAAVWAAMARGAMHDGARLWEYLTMLSPIEHASTPAGVGIYKVEPYVVAADVYTAELHKGRGGWTWYTGSAGWMYRVIIETLLGLGVEADQLTLTPVLPPGWTSFKIAYQFRQTKYDIQVTVKGPQTWVVKRMVVDGSEQAELRAHLVDDQQSHTIVVEVG